MFLRALRLIASLMTALCLCVALVLVLGAAHSAHAATAATRNYPGTAPCSTTLQACINGSNDGDEIVITAGVYITSIDLGKNLRLRGVSSATTILQALPNRKVITASAALNPGFQMEIMSLTVRGGNMSSGGAGAALFGAGINHLGAAPLLIHSVLITGNGLLTAPFAAGGLEAGGGPVTLLNTAFVNNRSLSTGGGAIDANAPITIVNSYFEENSCTTSSCTGGAIRIGFSTPAVISSSALFTGNSSQGTGGAIGSFGTLLINGQSSSAVRFERNRAPSQSIPSAGHGGAIYAEGDLALTGAAFVSNTAIGDGGGILVSGTARAMLGTVAVSEDLSYLSNRANGVGGAVAILGNSTANIARMFPTANAAGRGGGLYIGPSAVVSMELSTFIANTATVGSGGGILNDGSLTLIPNGFFPFPISFIGNRAVIDGGGIATTGTLTIRNAPGSQRVKLEANTANRGGGLYAGNSVRLESLLVIANTTTGNGGGLRLDARGLISNATLERNDAGGSGGGLSIGSAGSVTVGNTVISANTAFDGGGISSFGSLTFLRTESAGQPILITRNQAPFGSGGGIRSIGTLVDRRLGSARIGLIANTALNSGGGLFGATPVSLDGWDVISNSTSGSTGIGGGLNLGGSGSSTISDTLVQQNSSDFFGGGIFANIGLNMAASQVISNAAGGVGGGIFVLTASITSTLIQNNRAGANGGGIFANAALNMVASRVISNAAATDGGGVYLASMSGGGSSISGTLVQNNRGDNYGGGIFANAALNVAASQVISNSAIDGGGVYITGTGGGGIAGTLIQNNRGDSNGGGIFSGADLGIAGSQVISNAAATGGGIYASSGLIMTGSQVLKNAATFGGGIYATALFDSAVEASVRLIDSTIERNSANVGGGLNTAQPTAITSTDFISNFGAFSGGGIVSTYRLQVAGGQFTENRTSTCAFVGRGGALALGGYALLRDTTMSSNEACDGGGAFVAGEIQVLGGRWTDNIASNLGGAIYYTSPTGIFAGADTLGVTATQFISNRALNGGGLFLRGNDARIVNTLLARNAATGGTVGAAIATFGGSTRILHATIADRALNPKDAINANGTINISNTIITSHTTGIRRAGGAATEDYNRFFGNGTNSMSVITGTHSLIGDPRFANPAIDDYRLTAASGTAINAGFNFGVATDFEGNPRSFGGAPDIGYDEYALQVYLPLIRR